jgi:hypothetical protein
LMLFAALVNILNSLAATTEGQVPVEEHTMDPCGSRGLHINLNRFGFHLYSLSINSDCIIKSPGLMSSIFRDSFITDC